jgi:hypothetical protein
MGGIRKAGITALPLPELALNAIWLNWRSNACRHSRTRGKSVKAIFIKTSYSDLFNSTMSSLDLGYLGGGVIGIPL